MNHTSSSMKEKVQFNLQKSSRSTSMDEKRQPDVYTPPRFYCSTISRLRLVYLIMLIMMAVWLSGRLTMASYQFMRDPNLLVKPISGRGASEIILLESTTKRIPLEAHIMSKCPDARDCLQQLVVPAMEKISGKVEFNLSFIGSVNPKSDEVSCKHGPAECLGDMILLCAASLYPDPKLHLGFANCMISDYDNIPQQDLVEGCAMEHGVAFGKINSCISDEGTGVGLLYSSVARSERNNVTRSCTVRLNGKVRCIRDGGQWKDCEDGSSVRTLVRDVEDLYDTKNK